MKIVYKLKSKTGASFIIALIYFLVCMMVGSVMITAASADRGRAAYSIIERRDFYAVQSAATIFRDGLLGITYEDDYQYYVSASGNQGEYEREGYFLVTNTENPDNPTPDKQEPGVKDKPNPKFNGGVAGGEGSEEIESQSINDPVFKGLEESDFTPLYNEIAKALRRNFYKEILKLDEVKQNYGYLDAFTTQAFNLKGNITAEDGTPINVDITIGEDYSILATFTGAPAADAGGTPSGEGGADTPSSEKTYSVTLTITPYKTLEQSREKKNYYVDRVTLVNGVTESVPQEKVINIVTESIKLSYNNAAILRSDVSRNPGADEG